MPQLLWVFYELTTRVYIIFCISNLGKLRKLYSLGRRHKIWKRIYCHLNVLKYLLKEALLLISHTEQCRELISQNISAGSRQSEDNSTNIKNKWHSRTQSSNWVISVEPHVFPTQTVNETVYKEFKTKSSYILILDQKVLMS